MRAAIVLVVLAPLLAAVFVAGLRGAGVFDDEAPPAAAATPTATASPTAAPAEPVTIDVGRGPDGITVDDDGVVWVADATAGRVVQIRGDEVTGDPIDAGAQPDSPVVADGVLWVVASADDAVRRIDDGDVQTIPVGNAPESLAVGGAFIYVTNGGDGTVTRIDRASGEVVGGPIGVGGRPLDIAVDGETAWVTSFDDGTVTPIEVASSTPGDPIDVGGQLRGVAVAEGSVWVADASGDTVTPISADDRTRRRADHGRRQPP